MQGQRGDELVWVGLLLSYKQRAETSDSVPSLIGTQTQTQTALKLFMLYPGVFVVDLF